MAETVEKAQNQKGPAPKQKLSPKERYEQRQEGKRRAVENNPNAIVFVPESPVARRLTNAIQLIDSADAIMRSQAGLEVEFKDFEEHLKEFQAISTVLEEKGKAMLALIAKNDKVQTRFIRNRFVRGAVEDMRKEIKKAAATGSAKPEAAPAKEGEPATTKK